MGSPAQNALTTLMEAQAQSTIATFVSAGQYDAALLIAQAFVHRLKLHINNNNNNNNNNNMLPLSALDGDRNWVILTRNILLRGDASKLSIWTNKALQARFSLAHNALRSNNQGACHD